MKKVLILLIALLLVLPLATVASAATMTMTLTVPEAEYTLVIPQNQQIPFRSKGEMLGPVSTKNASGFAEGKNLRVTVSAAPFTSATTDTVLTYTLSGQQAITGGKEFALGTNFDIVFEGQSDGSLGFSKVMTGSGLEGFDCLEIDFNEDDWDDLKPGDYTATITFNAQIVEN